MPLYALLPAHLQQRVFQETPDGSRMVIIATNVAETSLTIPGIRYVVDAGRAKERVYERDASLSRFQVGWVSKASADQRAGRAGRTSPGHCYRLFSSAHFVDEMKQHADPQILSVPIEGVVLQMRAMGIDKVVNFPFISPPDKTAVHIKRRGAVVDEERERIYLALLFRLKKFPGLVKINKAKTSPKTTQTTSKQLPRSEERRVGKECRSRWSPYH